MNKYLCQKDNEYFTVEAENYQDAMMLAVAENATVIGEYTKYAHLFGE